MRALLARALWMQGYADQAMRAAEESIEDAQTAGHVMSLCYALALAACPITLWAGNLTAAAQYTNTLATQSRKHGLALLSSFAARFQRVLVFKEGGSLAGSPALGAETGDAADPNASFAILTGLSEQVEALGQAGRCSEALALLEAGSRGCEPGWLTPELLRLRGELFLMQALPRPVKRRTPFSGRRSMKRAGKDRWLGSCAPR
jgi:hypothetical protein